MEQKRNSPKIRFSEFSDEWKEYSMGELYSERKEQGNDSLPILSVSIHTGISDGELDEEGLGKTVRRSEDKSTYKHVYAGDLVFNMMRAWQGAIGSAPSEGMISPAYISAMPNDKVYPPFMDHYVKRKEMIEQINSLSYGVTDFRKRLYWDSFVKIRCKLPSYKEQIRIADVLSEYDGIIVFQEKVLNQLKNLKKGMLQKMFPKEGESVPEIRFPGFTDSWRQRKLSTLCEIITVGIANSATHAYADDGIVMFRNQNIKENYLDDSDLIYINGQFEKKYKKKRLKKNDLLVARTGYPGTACVVPEKYEGSQTFTTLIARLSEGTNPYYACQYINSEHGKKYFLATQIGGGQKNSGAGILEEFLMLLPPTIEEQDRLAEYFGSIDNLITLHQRERDKWKELKKGLMQQLFV